MLSFFRQLLGQNNHQPADQLAREIAERSVSEARQRLRPDVSMMSMAELRGYVRARALRPVRRQAQQVIAGHGRQVVVASDLVTRALERTVHIIVRQLMLQPATTTNKVRNERRRAG